MCLVSPMGTAWLCIGCVNFENVSTHYTDAFFMKEKYLDS